MFGALHCKTECRGCVLFIGQDTVHKAIQLTRPTGAKFRTIVEREALGNLESAFQGQCSSCSITNKGPGSKWNNLDNILQLLTSMRRMKADQMPEGPVFDNEMVRPCTCITSNVLLGQLWLHVIQCICQRSQFNFHVNVFNFQQRLLLAVQEEKGTKKRERSLVAASVDAAHEFAPSLPTAAGRAASVDHVQPFYHLPSELFLCEDDATFVVDAAAASGPAAASASLSESTSASTSAPVSAQVLDDQVQLQHSLQRESSPQAEQQDTQNDQKKAKKKRKKTKRKSSTDRAFKAPSSSCKREQMTVEVDHEVRPFDRHNSAFGFP